MAIRLLFWVSIGSTFSWPQVSLRFENLSKQMPQLYHSSINLRNHIDASNSSTPYMSIHRIHTVLVDFKFIKQMNKRLQWDSKLRYIIRNKMPFRWFPFYTEALSISIYRKIAIVFTVTKFQAKIFSFNQFVDQKTYWDVSYQTSRPRFVFII